MFIHFKRSFSVSHRTLSLAQRWARRSKGVKDKLSSDPGSTAFQPLYNTLLQTGFPPLGILVHSYPVSSVPLSPHAYEVSVFLQSSIPNLQNSSTCKPGNVLIKIKQDPLLLNLSVNTNWEKHTMPQLLKSCGFPRRMSIPQTIASRGMFCQDELNDIRSCNLKRKRSNLWSFCFTD